MDEERARFASLLEELPEEIREPLTGFEAALKDVEEHLASFVSLPWDKATEGMSETEMARVNVAMSYALNTLYFMYLKTQGVPTANHPVKQELERVRRYLKKVKTVVESAEEKKQNLKLNIEAANRFIMHALSDQGHEQPEQPADEAPTNNEAPKDYKDDAAKMKSQKPKRRSHGGSESASDSKSRKKSKKAAA